MSERLDPRPVDRPLFERLRAAAHACGGQVRAWIVGGYTRDRLLGREPGPELDVAVSGVTGLAFARALGPDVRAHGHGGAAAPLQNGQATIGGVQVDFARLRRESYGDVSRIPALHDAEASLEEDAARRDFAINALYLDLASGAVVDPTGAGLADLRARRLRTPIDALDSLRQDPLRLFRGVRFAAQLGFDLEPLWLELPAPAERDDLAEVFRRKLGAARVREELLGRTHPSWKPGALTGRGASEAWSLLERAGARETWLGAGHARAGERLRALELDTERAEDPLSITARALLAALGTDAESVLERLALPRALAQRVRDARALEAHWTAAHGPSDRALRAAFLREAAAASDVVALCAPSFPDLRARADAAFVVLRAGPPLEARDVMALGWPPGPALGQVLERLREAWLDDPTLEDERARALVLAWLSEKKDDHRDTEDTEEEGEAAGGEEEERENDA